MTTASFVILLDLPISRMAGSFWGCICMILVPDMNRKKCRKQAKEWWLVARGLTAPPPPPCVSPSNPSPSICPFLDIFMCFSVSLCVSLPPLFSCHFPFPCTVSARYPSQMFTYFIPFPTPSTILYCTFRQWHWRTDRTSVVQPYSVSFRLSALLHPQLEDAVSILDMRSCTIITFSFFNTQESSHNSTFLLRARGTILVISYICWILRIVMTHEMKNSLHCITIHQSKFPDSHWLEQIFSG